MARWVETTMAPSTCAITQRRPSRHSTGTCRKFVSWYQRTSHFQRLLEMLKPQERKQGAIDMVNCHHCGHRLIDDGNATCAIITFVNMKHATEDGHYPVEFLKSLIAKGARIRILAALVQGRKQVACIITSENRHIY